MRLTHLRSFHAVARAGSFTGAAKLLHISQPTVTTQVRFLEQTYGVHLFYRLGHTVRLTPLGDEIFALTQKIFSLENDVLQIIQDSGKMKSGQLRVGAVGPFHVTKMLVRFKQSFSGIDVTVRIGNSASVMSMLLNYETDVAVLAQMIEDPRLYSIAYSRHPVVLFVNRKHPFANRDSISITELNGEEIILREEGSTTRKALDDAFHQHHITPNVVMEIGSREGIREAVIRGLGVGAVSEVEYVADRAIHMLRIRDAKIYTYAHVVCLKDRKDARLISEFLKIAKDLRVKPVRNKNSSLRR